MRFYCSLLLAEIVLLFFNSSPADAAAVDRAAVDQPLRLGLAAASSKPTASFVPAALPSAATVSSSPSEPSLQTAAASVTPAAATQTSSGVPLTAGGGLSLVAIVLNGFLTL
ncbi:hypothetical protein JCM8547_004125 [Rhodosporidiobolus lusitaniae]